MTPTHLLIGFGVLLLLIGIVGGGFEVKELRIPRVGRRSRVLSLGFGSALVAMGSGVIPSSGAGGAASGGIPTASAVVPAAAEQPAAEEPTQPATVSTGLRRLGPVETLPSEDMGEPSEPIMNQLQEVSNLLANEGFTLFDTASGSLASSQSETFEIDMEAGFNYVLAGACDENCNDLDLEVRTPDGVTIASDYEPNDQPAVRVTPGAGRFVVSTSMYECAAAPCNYNVAVYRR
jgi:hypothetical protein